MAVRREADRYIARLRHADQTGATDPEVVPLTRSTSSGFWATPEETADLMAAFTALFDEFAGRIVDPAARPVGARLMRMFSAINPDMVFEPTAEASSAAPQQQEDWAQPSPASCTSRAICTRLVTPSFANRCATCVLTVASPR